MKTAFRIRIPSWFSLYLDTSSLRTPFLCPYVPQYVSQSISEWLPERKIIEGDLVSHHMTLECYPLMQSRSQPELLCSRGYSLSCYAVEVTAGAAMQSRLQPELLCSRGYSLSCYAVEVTAGAAMQSRLQIPRIERRNLYLRFSLYPALCGSH